MRRPRYKGKYPKRAEEKYKELRPDLFSDELEHIREQGRTPLGTHIPIMVDEVLQVLNPQPGETVVDLTLGYGGHAERLLRSVGSKGRLIGFDQDPIELPKTVDRLRGVGFGEEQFTPIERNFRELGKGLEEIGVRSVDMIFADLGLSSMQIDQPERGFSFKQSSPLDLRMNPTKGISAYIFLQKSKQEELEEILREHSDEPFPHKIAKLILAERKQLHSIQDLTQVVERAVKEIGSRYPDNVDKAVKRVVQALRIAVNDEFSALEEMLQQIPQYLKPGGRVGFLSFHSGEDRRIKKFLQNPQIFTNTVGPITATAEEIARNRRARPAKLRGAQRLKQF